MELILTFDRTAGTILGRFEQEDGDVAVSSDCKRRIDFVQARHIYNEGGVENLTVAEHLVREKSTMFGSGLAGKSRFGMIGPSA